MTTGERKLLTYPKEFSPASFPDGKIHDGQEVTVLREAVDGSEYDGPKTDPELERMWLVRADDGWEGLVFEGELS
jgi:hypothetical protein